MKDDEYHIRHDADGKTINCECCVYPSPTRVFRMDNGSTIYLCYVCNEAAIFDWPGTPPEWTSNDTSFLLSTLGWIANHLKAEMRAAIAEEIRKQFSVSIVPLVSVLQGGSYENTSQQE